MKLDIFFSWEKLDKLLTFPLLKAIPATEYE